MVISNKELTESRVRNFKKMQERRVVFGFGVTYDTPVKKMKKVENIVSKIFDKIENASLDRIHFKNFGDFSLNFEIVYHVHKGDYLEYMNIQQEVNFAIKEVFTKEKIEMAFPTQTVYVNKLK